METTQEVEAHNVFAPSAHFSSVFYTINKPEYLESVKTVSNKALEVVKKEHEMNETYPMVMSAGMMGNPDIRDFETFIAQAGWNILDNQGYNMTSFNTFVSELWCQEHFKYSGMEQHVHPYGVLLSGFYFLETPEDGPMVEFHDPRPGKVQASLPAKDLSKITEANNSVYIKPEPGLVIISNSWLPHSFTRNASSEACKFIHFNISAMPAQPASVEPAIVV